MLNLTSLASPDVVRTTTSSDTSDAKVGIMQLLVFKANITFTFHGILASHRHSFLNNGLTLIPTRIINFIIHKVCGVIT